VTIAANHRDLWYVYVGSPTNLLTPCHQPGKFIAGFYSISHRHPCAAEEV